MKAVRFLKRHFIKIVSILLALLFIYAASSKLLDFENFQIQLAQSPLLSAYAGILSYSIIVFEFVIAIMLCIVNTRRVGMYAALGLMVGFTIYIYLILEYSDFIPCSCGGILEKLGWTEHLIFNICFVILSAAGIFMIEWQDGRRMWRTVILTCSTTVVSCLLVVAMFLSSESIMKTENNFTRRFLQHPILIEKNMDLKVNSYYIAGVAGGNIYLGNSTAPLLVTVVDTSLRRLFSVYTKIDRSDHNFKNIKLQIKKPYYYLYDGTVPVIYRGMLGDSLARTISYKDAYFNQLVVLDTMKFAIRTQRGSDSHYSLALLDLLGDPKVRMKPDVLEAQKDGIFDVDGSLISDDNSKRLAYTYVYRNQFIVMDSSVTVVNRLRTIDTTSYAKITITKLSDGSRKMGAPPFSVNKRSVIAGNLLFNESNLKGKFEPADSWKSSSIMDAYHLEKQQYMGSFYINHRKGQHLSSLMVSGDHLYAIVGNELRRYKIRREVFK